MDKGDGHFEPRAITPGLRAEKLVEVLAGLKAGEKVASSANFLIDSEAKLKGVEARGALPAASRKQHRHQEDINIRNTTVRALSKKRGSLGFEG